MAPEEIKNNMLVCPTHRHGRPEEAAGKIFLLAEETDSTKRTVQICRSNFEAGLDVFAQCVELISLTPLRSNPSLETQDWLSGLLGLTTKVKRQSEPGIFRVIIDDWIQLPGKGSGSGMGTSELRAAVYAQIACGAKHVSFREKNFLQPQQRRAIAVITGELNLLSSLLAISEPVDLISRVSTPNVVCNSLLCGDKSVIVIALRKSFHAGQTEEPFDITINPPDWMPLSTYFEVGGASTKGTMVWSADGLKLNAELLDNVAVFVLRKQ